MQASSTRTRHAELVRPHVVRESLSAGYACVWAPERSRESILRSM
ncbi:MAG TPA: hypothetical protein VM492_14200 [Sumerlaeia bacterium]|nr:hypothetical protein [Sumerlaeia bacterium]